MEDNFFEVPTEIKPSSIPGAGNGRFFKCKLNKFTIIRRQKIGSDSLHILKNIDDLKKYDLSYLKDFGHSLPQNCIIKNNYVYLNFPPMCTNHSNFPNIDYIYSDSEKITYTICDVQENDEILQDYSKFRKIKWFEDYLHKNNMISARELGIILKN